ncbi:MAG TPA: caspase family protein [Polyangiaceae bacterium]|jgi:hypothetical protein
MSFLRAFRAVVFPATFAASVFQAGAAHAAPPTVRRIAILVGANDPPPGRPALRYAHDDATDLAEVLQHAGGFAPGDVHVLLDPHPRDLSAALDDVARAAAAAKGDVFFVFYYSGHSDGQSLYPHGERIALADVRGRVERLGARIRIGILDTCRGGSWTQSKGLTVGPPLGMADLLNVGTEGTALVSSSSGLESAHEAAEVHGSFFTHYLTAGLRGAADRAGDGNVTLEEAFDYAKERTVRDSARLAKTPQHPSFDLALRGRQDVVITVLASSTSGLQIGDTRAPVEVIHLPSGVTVADAPGGASGLKIAIPPGRYLVRSVVDGRVYAKEVEVHAGETVTLAEKQLEATGTDRLAMKGDDEEDEEDADDEEDVAPPAPEEKTPRAETDKDKNHPKRSWKFPGCNDTDPDRDGAMSTSSGCGGIFGVRGSVVTAATGTATTQLTGLEVGLSTDAYWHKKLYTGQWTSRMGLGGGGAGFEGALFGAGSFGIRAPVTDHQGPVVRAGALGYMLGNNAFYSSVIELPQLQAGWQWSRGHAVIDIGATSGVVLTGRFRSGDAATRQTGTGFAYGGHLAVQVPWIQLSAMAERLPGEDGLDAVDMAMGNLCVVASPLAICGDALVEQSHARVASGAEPFVRTTYAGLTLAFIDH